MNTQTDQYLQPAEASSNPDAQPSVNVGETERIASLVGGAALFLLGLERRSLGGLIVAAAGGAIAYRGYSGSCGLYKALGVTSAQPAPPEKYNAHGIHVEVATTIGRPAAELFAFWRQFDNLPKFMKHLESVTVVDDKHSKWVAKGPAGSSVRWDAEIINEEPDSLIAWRSLAGAQVDNAGSVKFTEAPEGRGTEVRVTLDYIPPGRTLGKWVAKLLGEEPQLQIEEDLRRFKALMETGELPTNKADDEGVEHNPSRPRKTAGTNRVTEGNGFGPTTNRSNGTAPVATGVVGDTTTDH